MYTNLESTCRASSLAYERALLEFGRTEVVTPCTVLDRYVAVLEVVVTHHASVRAAHLAIIEAQLGKNNTTQMIAVEMIHRVTTQSEAIRTVSEIYDAIVTGLDDIEEESDHLRYIKHAQTTRDLMYTQILGL